PRPGTRRLRRFQRHRLAGRQPSPLQGSRRPAHPVARAACRRAGAAFLRPGKPLQHRARLTAMTTPAPFKLHPARLEPGLALVSASGQISEPMFASSDPLADLLGPDCRKLRVLLNLEQTTFIDSSGINWLVRSFVAFRDGGGRLVLHSVAPGVLDT